MSSVWDWARDFARRANQNNDQQRIDLCQTFNSAFRLRRSSPDQGIAVFEQAQSLAKQIGEPWFEMLCEHYIIQTLFLFKRDYTAALKRAAPAVVEVRKPKYNGLPQRDCLQNDLTSTYSDIDPIGYEGEIAESIAHMEKSVDPRFECFDCLLSLRADFEIALDCPDRARHFALQWLEQPSASGNSSSAAYELANITATLCRIEYAAKEWLEVLRWSQEGLRAASETNSVYLAELYAWHAAGLRWRGDLFAHEEYLKAAAEAAKVPESVSNGYFDAIIAYHEHAGDLDQTLKARQHQVAEMVRRGRKYDEFKSRLGVCRLLVQLGRPYQEEMSAARDAAAKLRRPADFLRQLDELEKGAP